MTSSTGGEFHGKSVEEATEAGLAALGLRRSQVEIEVLSRGSRGLLGFGAEDARVRITPIAPKEPAPPKPQPRPSPPPEPVVTAKPEPKPVAKPAPERKPQPQPETRPAAPVQPAEDGEEDAGAVATQILQGMLERMDVRAVVHVVDHEGVLDEGQEPPLVLNIEGEDLGILIGRRGETLAAIQYLTRLMVNHRLHRWTNLVVDVEGYKARREEQLVRLAERMAERVVNSGRAVALEAMPARERRIVHIALRNHPTVTTQSVGEGDNRKVTIVPKV